ncbi:ABC-type amino acid transport system, pemease component [Liquorilactobacillus aquaticus DSM 21051]|uniref:ABC-type amino acid transport system, pemease component n=1 Tax=Liquorilactobacillus aquaticus DSM 21051 TaxID=1423725 RepID=A0A0R2CTL6_9LACO|nr:amino acid ABC transporter permease [Liquorilactobacillus aquaticus]KRM95112.1 ABC-type amino acid transport system, pemease component [Liquorilactobacillus aquaticus DSM 21051]
MTSFNFQLIIDYLPYFFKGIIYTIGFSIASIALGTVFGLLIALGKMLPNKFLAAPFKGYVGLFRGTPLLVQILVINFGVVPLVLGKSNSIVAGILALSLNSSAYIAEIFRSGIQAVSEGQGEAAATLGLSPNQTMLHIILPQAVKIILPPLGNEFISLIKDSSLASVISAPEVTYWAQAMNAQYYRVWEPYLTSGLIYLILTLSISSILHSVERRLAVND